MVYSSYLICCLCSVSPGCLYFSPMSALSDLLQSNCRPASNSGIKPTTISDQKEKKEKEKKEKPVWKARYREFFLFILISVFIITLLLLCLDFTGLQNKVRYQDGKLKHFAYTSSRARRRRGETGAETYKLTIHEPAHVQLFCKHI